VRHGVVSALLGPQAGSGELCWEIEPWDERQPSQEEHQQGHQNLWLFEHSQDLLQHRVGNKRTDHSNGKNWTQD